MTVDDVLRELCYVCGHSKITRGMLERLIYTESVRAAAMVRTRGGKRSVIGTSEIADEILATSPGTVGA